MLFLCYEIGPEKRMESGGCGLLEGERVAGEKAALESLNDIRCPDKSKKERAGREQPLIASNETEWLLY